MANESSTGVSNEQANKEGKETQRSARRQTEASQERRRSGSESRALSRHGPYAPLLRDIGTWGSSPFSLMRRFMEDLDRLFDEVGSGRALSPSSQQQRATAGESLWVPQLDVLERDGRLVVRADLPGMSKDDIRLEITGDSLVLEGERRQEREVEGRGMYRSERSYGSFCRAIPLPDNVNPEGAEAHFENGVLEVTLPLNEDRARARRIEIQEGKQHSVH